MAMGGLLTGWRGITWLALLATVSCGSSTDYGDAPTTSGVQISWDSSVFAVRPETMLAVVDDTAAGDALREKVATAFDNLDAAFQDRQFSCRGPYDPAAWHPIDRSLVVVHPSTAGISSYSSPLTDPGLRFRTNQFPDADHALWTVAVRAALAAHPAQPGAPFQALAALLESLPLLDGLRVAVTQDERALLGVLPPPSAVPLLIALATEDQSPGLASEYNTIESAIKQDEVDEVDAIVVPAALPQPGAVCSDRAGQEAMTTPRYSSWSDTAQRWPCEDPLFFDVPSGVCHSAAPLGLCQAHPIAVDDAGVTQCRITASYPGTDPCPTEQGWLDPLAADGSRVSRLDQDGSGEKRVCEVRQLEGAALASCRASLDCSGCEPGWCATEVPELILRSSDCPAGSSPLAFRWVLGADQARDATLHFSCNVSASD